MHRDTISCVLWAAALGIAGWADAQRGAVLGIATLALAPLAIRLLVVRAASRRAPPPLTLTAQEIEALAWQPARR